MATALRNGADLTAAADHHASITVARAAAEFSLLSDEIRGERRCRSEQLEGIRARLVDLAAQHGAFEGRMCRTEARLRQAEFQFYGGERPPPVRSRRRRGEQRQHNPYNTHGLLLLRHIED